MPIDLKQSEFESTVTDNEIVLVDWWASWCGPCRMFAPVFEAAEAKHADIVFAKVDTEAEQGLAGAAGISSIPTLMAFRDGILVFSQPGALPAQGLEQVIQAVRDLDMEEIRAKYEAALAAQQRENDRDVAPEEFAKRAQRDDVVVLDVRTPGEYESGHLKDAVLLDVQGDGFADCIAQLDKNAEYAVYCRSGNRSGQALRILEANGFTNAYHLRGGITAWQQAGAEVVTT